MQPIIETENLSKYYKEFHAIKGVSFHVNKGEIYGFIGLNGAGKTTMIRMMLGMIRPTKGACYINGKRVNLQNHSIWKNVGYIVETPYAYPELTVKENLEVSRRLYSILDRNAVRNIMDKLQLTRYGEKKAKNLSLGNAQRLGIAKALLHQPQILLLDEPVNGLDPAGIVEIRELLKDLAFNQGVTIFISSHLLSEIAKITTKIGIIHEGKLHQELSSSELTQLLNRKVLVDVHDKSTASTILTKAGYQVSFTQDGLINTYSDKAIRHPEEVTKLLVQKGHFPKKLTIEEEDLENYFLRVIAKKGDE
jgi:ABC-2 type transport system ATP-binding protein